MSPCIFNSMWFEFGGVLDYRNVRIEMISISKSKNLPCLNEINLKHHDKHLEVGKCTGKKAF